jgi:hypothetical protein
VSSHPSGSLWVDPEGVGQVGDRYAEQAGQYDTYHQNLRDVRERYAPAWGDDSIGNQLKEPFDQVMDTVDGIITGVSGTLDYTAKGLQGSGTAYRQADDDATRAGHFIRTEFESLPTSQPGTVPLERARVEEAPMALERARLVEAPMALERKQAEEAPVAMERMRAVEAPLAGRRMLKSVKPMVKSVKPMTTGLMTSAMALYPGGSRIDGTAIPAGYDLQKLTTLPDGTSRVDVNYYDAIVPVGTGHAITGPDGQPLDTDGGQFFLVRLKDSSQVDATAPGYQPMIVSFSPDGTAVPVSNQA